MKPRLPNEVWIGALSALIFSIPLWFGIFCCVKAHATEPIANAFGDSITCGTGASTPANDYANLIGSSMGWTINNQCYSGHELADFFPQIYGTTVTDQSISFALLGFNDMRHYGTSSAGQQSFRNELYSALVWLSVPQANIILAQGHSVTYTGSWSNTTVYGGGIGKYSNTNGSTATFNVYGSVIYVDIIQFRGFTRSVDVNIDGINEGPFNGSSFAYPNSGTIYAPYLLRFPNLPHQLHTVVLTIEDGSGYAYFNWAAGNDGNYNKISPALYVGNALRMIPNGYTEGELPQWANGSDQAAYEYSQIIRQAVSDLSGDGLNIAFVNADAKYILFSDTYIDNIHPNDSGHAHIAQSFLYQMNTNRNGF